MEESAKRRERLRAMHMGATQSEVLDCHGTLTDPSYLENPLIQPTTTPPPIPPVPRFDYYTDPVSAFSGDKRRGSSSSHSQQNNFVTPPSGPRNTYMTPSSAPANHFQVNYPLHQGSSEMSLPSPQPGSWRSPAGMPNPMRSLVSGPAGPRNPYISPSPVPANQFQVNYPLHQGSSEMSLPSPQPGSWRSPAGMPNPMRSPVSGPGSAGPRNPYISPSPVPANQFQLNYLHQGSSEMPWPAPQHGPWRSPAGMSNPMRSPVSAPGTWNRSGGSSGYCSPQNSTSGGFSSPSFGQGSPRTNPGRDSPSSSFSGRGGNWRGGSSATTHSGWNSRGRGRGSLDYTSARDRPERFYNKSMAQDPWCNLEPVVGNILVPKITLRDPQQSWLPSSISTKKAKFTETTTKVIHSESSLAEYLALSFSETVDEAKDDV